MGLFPSLSLMERTPGYGPGNARSNRVGKIPDMSDAAHPISARGMQAVLVEERRKVRISVMQRRKRSKYLADTRETYL